MTFISSLRTIAYELKRSSHFWSMVSTRVSFFFFSSFLSFLTFLFPRGDKRVPFHKPFSQLCTKSATETDDTRTNVLGIMAANVRLVSASILHDLSDMQPQINAIKIEHPPYYCSSYTPPSAATTADHVQPTASFSEFQNLPLPLFLVDEVGVAYGSRDAVVRSSLN